MKPTLGQLAYRAGLQVNYVADRLNSKIFGNPMSKNDHIDWRKMIAESTRPKIIINPFSPEHLTRNSYRLHLTDKIMHMFDRKTTEMEIPASGFELKPGILYMAELQEKIEVNQVDASIEPINLPKHIDIRISVRPLTMNTAQMVYVQAHPDSKPGSAKIYPGMEIADIRYYNALQIKIRNK